MAFLSTLVRFRGNSPAAQSSKIEVLGLRRFECAAFGYFRNSQAYPNQRYPNPDLTRILQFGVLVERMPCFVSTRLASMSTHIGRFEILSEITKSERGSVYKATDPTNGQTVALKTLKLDMPAELSRAIVERVVAEAESTKSLNSGNIALLYGAGEIDGLLCATMEYVQGNSIATMLARKEGFSIWDLLDISRQVCQGLDHAHSNNVVHYSLEPAKVMVQWDGNVKILGFGVSTMGLVESDGVSPAPTILHYASPEDVSGGTVDVRSNFYTWGAVLYEMVTDLKAFDGENVETVRRKIMEEDPVPPIEINNKIQRAVSDLIMKALAKAPEARFQNGQELVEGLEQCKQASTQPAKKSSVAVPTSTTPKAAASAAAKFAGQPKAKPAPSKIATEASSPKSAAASAPERKPVARKASPVQPQEPLAAAESKTSETASQPTASTPLAQRAAAGSAGSSSVVGSSVSATPRLDPSSQFITSCVKASVEALEKQEAQMSAGVEEPVEAPKFATDPMMGGGPAAGTKQVSFSDLEELPPLKEGFWIAPTPPPAEEPVPEPSPLAALREKEREKPKIQPREMAQKAIKEIKSVPPKLMIYALAGSLGVILLICVVIAMRIHSQSADDDAGTVASVTQPTQATPAPAQAAVPVPAAEPIEPQMPVSVAPVAKSRSKHKTKISTPVAVAIVPGQLSIDSTPEGAQLLIDGRSDPTWVTPYNLTGLAPGQHTVSVNKSGFTSESRTVDIASGSKSFLVVHLAQMAATVSLTSDPTGASIFINGKDSGRVTPTQLTVEKGSHSFILRKVGYLDETTTADLLPGQTFRFSPSLKPLGNVDEIKTVGKFKKFFGGSDVPAGMGVVTIKTQPKGAQIAINQRMLDKSSPAQFVLGPGNYIVDVSLTGYKPIHRVINLEKGNKVALDEVMEHE
jgi:serine/threonine protein kinase